MITKSHVGLVKQSKAVGILCSVCSGCCLKFEFWHCIIVAVVRGIIASSVNRL